MSSYNNQNNTLTKFGSNIRVSNTPMEQYVTEGELVEGLATKQDILQYDVLPSASAENLGKIVQYIGETTTDYVSGSFYKCVVNSNVYSWELTSVTREEFENEVAEIEENIKVVPWSATIDETPSEASLIRRHYPYNFEAGKHYEIQAKISAYTMGPGSVAMNLRTANGETVVEGITGEMYRQDIKENLSYTWSFTPTENADNLYLYLNSDATPIKITFTIYSQFIGEINDLVGKTGANSYRGQRVSLMDNTYNLYKEFATTLDVNYPQGMAIYNGKLFRLFDTGICSVYDIANKNSAALATFNLGSYGNNHANSCNFSDIFYDNTDIYPLLYVTDGNSAEVMRCAVERIANDLSGSTKVQTITLDQSDFESSGFETYWGWSAWLISKDALYYFGAKYRTNGSEKEKDAINKYIITKFDIPQLTDANVTLTASDVRQQWVSTYDTDVTQGGCVYGDYIFFAFGNPSNNYPSAIKVFSLSQTEAIAKIDLNDTLLSNLELEDLCVYDGKLIVATYGQDVFSIEFK